MGWGLVLFRWELLAMSGWIHRKAAGLHDSHLVAMQRTREVCMRLVPFTPRLFEVLYKREQGPTTALVCFALLGTWYWRLDIFQ